MHGSVNAAFLTRLGIGGMAPCVCGGQEGDGCGRGLFFCVLFSDSQNVLAVALMTGPERSGQVWGLCLWG